MGLFSKVKKVFNPGGAIVSKVINDGHDYQGILDYGMNGADNAKKNQEAQKQQQQAGYSPKPMFSPDPGLNPQARSLGWTSGGYRYNNNPFAQPAAQQAPPMSFGGGGGTPQLPPAPPQSQPQPAMSQGVAPKGPAGMGALFAKYQQGLQSAQGGGSMPAAGAPPSGQPTMQGVQNPQLIQAQALRGRIGFR